MTREYFGTKRVTAYEVYQDGEPGYGVIYADGYQSWSPKDVFEAAYQPLDAMSFGHALVALAAGARVARVGWNGKGMWVERQNPDAGSKMTLPYLFMRTTGGDLVPWLISQTDALANDWCIVSDPAP